MIEIPQEPKRGSLLEAIWGATVIRALKAMRPQVSNDIWPVTSPNGTSYRLNPKLLRAIRAAVATHPFKLLDASEGETKKIRVVYGTLNGELPEGMSPGDDPVYELTISGETGFVFIGVEVVEEGSSEVVSVWIDFAAEVPEDTETEFHFALGSWSTGGEDSLVLANSVTTSLGFRYCSGPDFWSA